MVHAAITNTLVPGLTVYSQQAGVSAVLADIVVRPDSVMLAPGDSVQFTASGIDRDGQTIYFTPVWNANGGTIDSTGLFIAGMESGTFEVSAGNQTGRIQETAHVQIGGITPLEPLTEPVRAYALYANHPNPFQATTTIAFDIPAPGPVRIAVFNLLGQPVATIADAWFSAGRHQAQFGVQDLPSGTYFYQMHTPQFSTTRKMVLMR